MTRLLRRCCGNHDKAGDNLCGSHSKAMFLTMLHVCCGSGLRHPLYVWAALPEHFKKMGSLAFAERLVRETGIAVAPGFGFGEAGDKHSQFRSRYHTTSGSMTCSCGLKNF